MENEIKIGKKIFIRNAGKDEYWLQDIIYEDPKILGLGDLVAVNKEKKQSSGGRLDILLKEPTENLLREKKSPIWVGIRLNIGRIPCGMI